MLKRLASNPAVPIEEVVTQTGIPRSTIYLQIHDFCIIYEKTVDRDDFPQDLMTFYNRFSDS
jgi:predicted DNA-binding transcriptional regulator AlpA